MRLEEHGQRRPGRRGSRPTAPATRPSSGARSRPRLARGELLAVVATDALELGHRHRRARRGDLRHLPRHGREPAPDVGAGRAAPRRASPSTSPARTRSTSSSAATPTSSSSARSRRRSSTTATSRSSSQHLLAAAYEAPLGAATTTRSSARAGASAPSALVALGELRRGRGGRYLPARPRLPGRRRSRCARPRPTRSRWSTRGSGEMLGSVEAERAFSTVHPGADLPAPRPLLRGRASSTSTARRAIVEPFDGDWYTQPKKETEVYIEEIARAARTRSAGSSSPSARSRSPSR